MIGNAEKLLLPTPEEPGQGVLTWVTLQTQPVQPPADTP